MMCALDRMVSMAHVTQQRSVLPRVEQPQEHVPLDLECAAHSLWHVAPPALRTTPMLTRPPSPPGQEAALLAPTKSVHLPMSAEFAWISPHLTSPVPLPRVSLLALTRVLVNVSWRAWPSTATVWEAHLRSVVSTLVSTCSLMWQMIVLISISTSTHWTQPPPEPGQYTPSSTSAETHWLDLLDVCSITLEHPAALPHLTGTCQEQQMQLWPQSLILPTIIMIFASEERRDTAEHATHPSLLNLTEYQLELWTIPQLLGHSVMVRQLAEQIMLRFPGPRSAPSLPHHLSTLLSQEQLGCPESVVCGLTMWIFRLLMQPFAVSINHVV